MKTFLLRISIFIAIQLLIASAILLNSPNQPSYGYLAAFEDKIQTLQEHREPNLILIGGSNLAFGIDSEILEDEIRLPTLNAGLHAGLGLQFYLDVAAKHARRGDTVILAPEYELFSSSLGPQEKYANELMRQSLAGYKHLYSLEGFDLKEFIDNRAFSEIAFNMQIRMKYHNAAREKRHRQRALQPGVYSRLHFNRHGDFVGHHGLPQAEVLKNTDAQYNFSSERYAPGTAAINQCAATLSAKGVRMFFAYPPITQSVYERSKPAIDKAHKFLKANLDISILHEPEEVSYNESCFFDTSVHLNESTKRDRTNVLAAALQRQFTVLASQKKREKLR